MDNSSRIHTINAVALFALYMLTAIYTGTLIDITRLWGFALVPLMLVVAHLATYCWLTYRVTANETADAATVVTVTEDAA